MKPQYHTFNYFSKTLLDPMFEIHEVLQNIDHPEYKNLKKDFAEINTEDLTNYVEEHQIDFFLDRYDDKDHGRRLHYFVNQINKEVARVRIEKLIDPTNRQDPYSFDNLKELIVDKNNLASIDQFNIDNFGLEKNNLVYCLCPLLEQSNSSYWIFKSIMKFTKENELKFKIRLDPFLEIPLNDYQPMFYKMLVHGKQLDWQRLLSLRNDDFGQWFDEKEYTHMGFTDYVWCPNGNEIHFTCEELPALNLQGVKTSRYFHAILSKKTGGIIHCDGALRVYSNHDLKSRSNYHVKDSEARKVGKRVKIFQYDSKENNNKEIDQNTFCQLVVNFFVWNDDVQYYFNK